MERVRNHPTSPPPASVFTSYKGSPIVLCDDGTAWMLRSTGTVAQIGEGMTMEQEVATTGAYRGKAAAIVPLMGARGLGWSSTVLLGDVAEYLNTSQQSINDVSTGTTYYLTSTSVQDAVGGTGVDQVKINYLDDTGAEAVLDVEIFGTTPVNLGNGFSYFLYMESEHSTVENRVAAGDITIGSINGAATVATTVEKITANGNRSLSGRYKVPTGCVAYLLDWHVGSIKAKMDCRLRAKNFRDGTLSKGFHFRDRLYLAADDHGERGLHYEPFAAGVEIKVSAIPSASAAGNKLDCGFDLIVVAV